MRKFAQITLFELTCPPCDAASNMQRLSEAKPVLSIRGSICALATPFMADGALDLAAFGRLLDYQLAGGTQALVVAGSTGEAHMLEAGEFDRLLAFALEHVDGRVPVIAGTGDAATAKTVAVTRRARPLGRRCRAGGDALLRAAHAGRLAPALSGSGRACRHARLLVQRAQPHRLRSAAGHRGGAARAPGHHRHQGSTRRSASEFRHWRNLCAMISSICPAMTAVPARPCWLAPPARSRWWPIWCRRRFGRCVMRQLAVMWLLPMLVARHWSRCCKRWLARPTRFR